MLHQLAQTSGSAIPDTESGRVRGGLDKGPCELRVERPYELRNFLEEDCERDETVKISKQYCTRSHCTYIALLICGATP